MKFGHLDDIEGVDFDIPLDDPSNKTLKRDGTHGDARIFLGLPVWFNKNWNDKVYPQGVKRGECLHYYSRQFNSIELNSTHYHMPTMETISSWRDQTLQGFAFCPKVYQKISHDYVLKGCEGLMEKFISSLLFFGDKLGPSFLQLPPHFSMDRLGDLESFLSQLPRRFSLAVEFRHPDCFEAHGLRPQISNVLKEFGATAVITDVAGRRDILHTTLTSNKAMIRFVGNGLHSTDYIRIDGWIERLQTWIRLGVEEIYFFIHEPDNDLSPDLGYYFIEKWNKCGFAEIPKPREVKREVQLSLFDPIL